MIKWNRKRAVVTTTRGHVFQGEQALSWPWAVRLINAETVDDQGKTTKVDGSVTIPTRSVEYLQTYRNR